MSCERFKNEIIDRFRNDPGGLRHLAHSIVDQACDRPGMLKATAFALAGIVESFGEDVLDAAKYNPPEREGAAA